MPRIKLTDRKIRALKSTAAQVDYWDSALPSFGIRVSTGNRKTWTIYYRFHGRKRRLTIGTYPNTTLAEARRRARNLLSRVSNGDDPAAESAVLKHAATFNDLQDTYVARHAKPKKKSWRNDVYLIKRFLLPKWRHVKACDVSQADVQAVIDAIAPSGPVLANRVLALISKLFAFSIAKKWRHDNPAHGIDKPTLERPRDRVLTPGEIWAVWNALELETPFIRAVFQLRLLTAARGGEIRRMRWIDLDLDTGWWTIPAEFSKNAVSHRVPLNGTACQLLESLRTWQVDRLNEINRGRLKKGWEIKQFSEWVFPSPRGNAPFSWEQRAAKRIRSFSGVDFRPHDLRRTVATLLTQHHDADRFILKRILNHVDRDITAVYDRNRYDDQKRAAIDSWGRRLNAIVTHTEQTGTVVSMASSRRSGSGQ
jgi:integrase